MTTLTLTRGIPASGKTQWAKEMVQYGYVRVNRDELRKELNLKHGQDEVLVSKIQQGRVRDLLENDIDVIVDDTNLVARFVKQWLKIAAEAGATVEFEDFPISFDTAVQRDYKRGVEGTGDSVGEEVIASFFDRFIRRGQLPEIPVLTDQEAVGRFEPYVETPGLPRAILVDIDGTLAHMNGRSPYDPTLYHTDTADDVIHHIVHLWEGAHLNDYVIIMSGRDEEYRAETLAWLAENHIFHDFLYMRPQGDKRNDAIVKNELFEKHIAGQYNVDFILDDRNRVVDMWRSKGLKCLQVAAGDF